MAGLMPTGSRGRATFCLLHHNSATSFIALLINRAIIWKIAYSCRWDSAEAFRMLKMLELRPAWRTASSKGFFLLLLQSLWCIYIYINMAYLCFFPPYIFIKQSRLFTCLRWYVCQLCTSRKRLFVQLPWTSLVCLLPSIPER